MKHCSKCKACPHAKRVEKHLKEDIKTFNREKKEDKELIKEIKHKKDPVKHDPKPRKNKIKVVMEEFKAGKLHSGSKHGPKVTNPKQAIAIAISESKKRKK